MIKTIFKSYILRKIVLCLFLALTLQGCIVMLAAVGTASVFYFAGKASIVDRAPVAIAVEKSVYAIEHNGGMITDFSFSKGYVKGEMDHEKVSVDIGKMKNGDVDVTFSARKYLLPDTSLAKKLLDSYKDYKR